MSASFFSNPAVAESDEDRYEQAERILHHLQSQLNELDRREQQFHEQMALLMQQERATHQARIAAEKRIVEINESVSVRENRVAAAEKVIAERFKELERSTLELSAQAEKFQQKHEEFEQHQRTAQARWEQELEQKRQLIEQDKTSFLQQRQQQEEEFRQQLLSQQQDFEEECRLKQVNWEQELQKQQQMLEQSRLSLKLQTEQKEEELLRQIEQEKQEILEARQQLEERTQKLLEQEEELAARHAVETEQHRLKLEELSAQKQAEWEQETQKFQQQLEQERLALQLQSEQREEEFLKQMEQDRQEILESQQQIEFREQELSKQEEEFNVRLQNEQQNQMLAIEEMSRERQANLDRREQELLRREIDHQKRSRLHESHLDRARQEVTSQRSLIESQRQKQRLWMEEIETSIRQRLGQMRHFRDLLAQREKSLQDEQQAFAERRKLLEEQLHIERSAILSERTQWKQLQQQAALGNQQHELRLKQEWTIVDSRRQALDALHEELKELISRFRHALADAEQTGTSYPGMEHLTQVLHLISKQQTELEQARHELRELQNSRRDESVALSEWIEERDQWVRNREEEFAQLIDNVMQQQKSNQQERDQQKTDRIQAEQVIRDLILQLEETFSQSAPLISDQQDQAA